MQRQEIRHEGAGFLDATRHDVRDDQGAHGRGVLSIDAQGLCRVRDGTLGLPIGKIRCSSE